MLRTIAAIATLLLMSACMSHSDAITKERIPEFALAPTDYGWGGRFPGVELRTIFGQEVRVKIDTRAVPDEPKILPPVSERQAGLMRVIIPALPAILKRVEEAMVVDNVHDPDFRQFIRNPHIWLNSEEDDGESWTLVIERTDNHDFGYHTEFKGTKFVEIWAGD